LLDDVIRWRKDFHQYPELEFDVATTASKVANLLSSFGIKVHSSIGISGLVGTLKCGSSSNAIGLRADMDALPLYEQNTFTHCSRHEGMMHACGHDGHMAMLLGAARILANTKNFDGTVHFIFQPNEERGLGAQQMINDGLFERFDMQAVYGMHNMPRIQAKKLCMKSGPIMAAEDNFSIKVKGLGGHSSQPHHCIDPIVIGAKIVTALQTITSRMLDPFKAAVISVTNFKTNGATNVIASEVEITGDCRSFDETIQNTIAEKMEKLVCSLCAAYGASHEFSYDKLFYPTINTPQETEAAINAAYAVNGKSMVSPNCQAMTASEDFSSMLRVKPGAYIFIGNGLDSHGGCMLHNTNYDFNDEILQTGINYWVTLVEQQLKAA
jgi:amidohydrolase